MKAVSEKIHISTYIYLALIVQLFPAVNNESPICASPQYLEVGNPGIVDCQFPATFFAVFWFNSSDYTDESQKIIYYSNSEKQGEGLLSGEFDIFKNGSLMINSVNLSHDHVYTVVLFKTKTEETITIYVDVIVTVMPTQSYPMIDQCKGQRFCYSIMDENTTLYCYVNDSKPAVSLTFLNNSHDHYNFTETSSRSYARETLTTSEVKTTVEFHETIISIYRCKARMQVPSLMDNDHSAIVIQNSVGVNFSTFQPEQTLVARSSRLQLHCVNVGNLYVVWMKQNTTNVEVHIAHKVTWEEYTLNYIDDRYEWIDDNLVIPEVAIQDEGLYACVVGDGRQERATIYRVNVYVQPTPSYLLVSGCYGHSSCTIPVARTGQLTCSMQKVHPLVTLQWRFLDVLSQKHTFHGGKSTVTKNVDLTYNVELTSKYVIDDTSIDTVMVECLVEHANEDVGLNLSIPPTRVTLLFPKGSVVPAVTDHWIEITIPVIGVLCLISILTHGYFRRKDRSKSEDNEEEQFNLMENQSENSKKLKNMFKSQLKVYYQEICEVVKPIPNSPTTYCINELFVDGGFEIMSKDEGIWKPKSSYEEALNDGNGDYQRVLVQGDSGFGKTFLCKKMAYDWYTRNESTLCGRADILIYLPAHLLNKLSLCSAVKQHILPNDSSLTETFIKDLLASSSAVIVLDDVDCSQYDEFSSKYDIESSDMDLILMNRAFQNNYVFITAKTGSLPKRFSVLKKQIKLVGFNTSMKNQYISNISGENNKRPQSKRRIEGAIQDMSMSCPLIFVLLSHLCTNNVLKDTPEPRNLTQAIELIVEMLFCIRHDNYVMTSDTIIQDSQLEDMAFKALSTSKEGYRLEKQDAIEQLGQWKYELYIEKGLLMEEYVCSKIKSPSKKNTVHYTPIVTFFHSIFLEYFAARKLYRTAELKKESDWWIAEKFDHVDPYIHQHVFRFASGKSKEAAAKIIMYLQEKSGTEKLTQYCIAESSF